LTGIRLVHLRTIGIPLGGEHWFSDRFHFLFIWSMST
jgi:hypothetical protein